MNERSSLRIPERLQRFAASVALTAYLVLTALGASLVFCHEADGRIAVEWSGGECCVEPADAGARGGDARGSIEPSHGGADCVECVDVPAAKLLTSTGATGRRSSVPKPDVAPCAPATCERPQIFADRGETSFRGAPAAPVPPPRLAMLRTVFIRC